jgi:hypothetical protein
VSESARVRAHVLVYPGVALVDVGNLEAAESSLRVAATTITHAIGPAMWVFCCIA